MYPRRNMISSTAAKSMVCPRAGRSQSIRVPGSLFQPRPLMTQTGRIEIGTMDQTATILKRDPALLKPDKTPFAQVTHNPVHMVSAEAKGVSQMIQGHRAITARLIAQPHQLEPGREVWQDVADTLRRPIPTNCPSRMASSRGAARRMVVASRGVPAKAPNRSPTCTSDASTSVRRSFHSDRLEKTARPAPCIVFDAHLIRKVELKCRDRPNSKEWPR